MLDWLEFCREVSIVLMPLLRWVHGPPVSGNQASLGSAVVVLALGGAIALRTIRFRCKAGNNSSP